MWEAYGQLFIKGFSGALDEHLRYSMFKLQLILFLFSTASLQEVRNCNN